MPTAASPAPTRKLAPTFRDFFAALKAACRWPEANADALRNLIELIVELPPAVEANPKENPVWSLGDDSMRKFVEKPSTFSPRFADKVLEYFEPAALIGAVERTEGRKRETLLEKARRVDPSVTDSTLDYWIADYIGDLLAERATRDDASALVNDGIERARDESARRNLRVPLGIKSGRICPVDTCGKVLTTTSGDQITEDFEIVVIDPMLSPRDEANLIALCHDCALAHGRNPLPKQVDALRATKEKWREADTLLRVRNQVQLFADIAEVLQHIGEATDAELLPIREPFRVSQKLPDPSNRFLVRRITREVADYFEFIRQELMNADKQNPGHFEDIQTSVKLAYREISKRATDPELIYNELVDWLQAKSQGNSYACALVISYFVQECTVFRVPPK